MLCNMTSIQYLPRGPGGIVGISTSKDETYATAGSLRVHLDGATPMRRRQLSVLLDARVVMDNAESAGTTVDFGTRMVTHPSFERPVQLDEGPLAVLTSATPVERAAAFLVNEAIEWALQNGEAEIAVRPAHVRVVNQGGNDDDVIAIQVRQDPVAYIVTFRDGYVTQVAGNPEKTMQRQALAIEAVLEHRAKEAQEHDKLQARAKALYEEWSTEQTYATPGWIELGPASLAGWTAAARVTQ
jgi:hypothetical protein